MISTFSQKRICSVLLTKSVSKSQSMITIVPHDQSLTKIVTNIQSLITFVSSNQSLYTVVPITDHHCLSSTHFFALGFICSSWLCLQLTSFFLLNFLNTWITSMWHHYFSHNTCSNRFSPFLEYYNPILFYAIQCVFRKVI